MCLGIASILSISCNISSSSLTLKGWSGKSSISPNGIYRILESFSSSLWACVVNRSSSFVSVKSLFLTVIAMSGATWHSYREFSLFCIHKSYGVPDKVAIIRINVLVTCIFSFKFQRKAFHFCWLELLPSLIWNCSGFWHPIFYKFFKLFFERYFRTINR